ncbi:hypothetical protein [Undibacterium crateris]|uniref:hypothetical protein n=1 Tax=Undibacterium crateris TaxID=2528175 RepID=UPI00138A5807|nr:hypothetical protein [Undibacterium crateris]NDI85052.1 hypothetical protein [Undibacterium crateris]
MPNIRETKPDNAFSSEWMGMSEYLIAKIFQVNSDGIREDTLSPEVHAPLIESELEATLNWQSPFENSSADQKAPALVAMLQSGAIIPFLKDIGVIDKGGSGGEMGAIERNINEFKGRTGITKLNSTQIFTGMPPIRITASLLFRAYRDPINEVETPLKQLWDWALPEKLSRDSLAARAKNSASNTQMALLPSKAPTMVGLQYKRRYYAPLVIENIREPLNSPIASDGYYTEIVVPVTLCSLTALDKDDMARAMNGV